MANVRPSRPGTVPEVRVLPQQDAALPMLLTEFERAAHDPARGVISFATGGTYAAMLRRLAAEFLTGRLAGLPFVATHLDEYLGFAAERRGGMVHELEHHCAPLRDLRLAGRFLAVPSLGTQQSLREHEARLAAHGGVQLQFLGIGRNGHLAFNEPGTPFDRGFHVTELAASTREDARARFAPEEPPPRACTAGLASILAATRLVLCAFGCAKAEAVRAMLEGDIGPQCPASALRLHGNALVLIDAEAASLCALRHTTA
jgi:glucosamine-6-phosphate deaminase